MFKRLIWLFSLLAVVILAVMLNFTTPTEVGPLGILLLFMMIYVVVFGLVVMLIGLYKRVLGWGRELRRKDYYMGTVIAFGPVMMLLMMQVSGSVNWFTLGLVVVFVGLGCLLVQKRLEGEG